MLFVGETPLGGAGGCPFHIMTVLGFLAMGKTMLKISARSDDGKCFFFAVEDNQLGKPVEHHPKKFQSPKKFSSGGKHGQITGS